MPAAKISRIAGKFSWRWENSVLAVTCRSCNKGKVETSISRDDAQNRANEIMAMHRCKTTAR